MSAYVVVDVAIDNREKYQQYVQQITPTVAACGGRYLACDADIQVLSGDWQPNRLVMMEFPDKATAEHWATCREYAPIHALRNRYAKANMVIIDGQVDINVTSTQEAE
ncbi:DUF1330 domain-containing protein [Neiella marina]|uniref:DUF1330 domain-containing protein n=1 Tax=Neiella holothuriorum TaxID=2870530 RepID=A0ABS7EDB3_9GAMM|nr:DUF1330 domain-containing protein [Neiella holothuriorum]MBW8189791.1 DUF1330 domain-containing protein [Neiella holothuriorum]